MTALFFIFLFLVASAHADNSHEALFKKGNRLYEKGIYDEAVKEYSRLLDQGFQSGNLYFNLGNSYFKKGEPGRAILNYERAKRLIPDDSDLQSNYNYALSKIEKTSLQAALPSIEKILGLFSKLTINGLAILVSVVYVGIISILTASIFIQSVRRYRIIGICILSIVFISGAFSLYCRVSVLDNEAIVISKNAEAKFEPLDNATTHFTLYEGMKVYILESKKDWSKIKRPDDKTGWIKSQDIEAL
ncbi:MAG: tetratricopeptide repeat protein [Nitrospirae bacterium]|nr:tetratricopeptide repeat protein [Nitrospirota bacterium]